MDEIPWFQPCVGDQEITRLTNVIASGYLNDGDLSRAFEQQIAKVAGTRYAVVVPSGTAALTVAILACGITGLDDVIVPDLTFIATANAVRLAGANVVLADVDPHSFCLTAETVEAALTPRSRMVIAVDVNGRHPNYNELSIVCRTHGLALITDSCEAFGSAYLGRPSGSIGRAGCFSFSPNKIITTGQGGAVTTNDEGIYNRCLELKNQGIRGRGTGGNDRHPTLGFNFKFTNLQAAVGVAQMQSLPERLAKAKQRQLWYEDRLSGLELVFPKHNEDEILLWTDILVDRRFALTNCLRGAGIGVREFWYPLHEQKPYYFSRGFPGAVQASLRGVWLPSSYDITEEQVEKVASVIRRSGLC